MHSRIFVYPSFFCHLDSPKIAVYLTVCVNFVHSRTVGKIVADYAIQVMGGAGYCREYPVERLWRDAKLLEVRLLVRLSLPAIYACCLV